MAANTFRQFLNGEVISTTKFLREDFSPLYKESEGKIQLGTRMIKSSATDDHSILVYLKTKFGHKKTFALGARTRSIWSNRN
jgi:hypothetical protein